MKPIEDFVGKIIQGDCIEVMKQMPDKCIDLVFTDPPYFNGPQKLGFYGRKDFSATGVKRPKYKKIGTWNIPGYDWYREVLRISKNQIIFGINYFPFSAETSGRLIWDKQNDSSSFSKAEIASCSSINTVQVYRYLWNGMLQADMKNKDIRFHPTQKPLKLMEQIIRDYSVEGELIADFYSGSGTIALACERCNRKWVAVEIEKEYAEKSQTRIDAERAQLKLF